MARWGLASLLLGPCLALAQAAPAKTVTVEGTVTDLHETPLAGVQITADEFGLPPQDTAPDGRFRVTVPPDVAQKGAVRLNFHLAGFASQNALVRLPPKELLTVALPSLASRSGVPQLPGDYVVALRRYRAADIARIQAFLSNPNKKLLVAHGMAGLGLPDLLLTAFSETPKASAQDIFWWPCESTDSLVLLAEELGTKVLRDPNLGALARPGQEKEAASEREVRERELLLRLLDTLKRSPRLLVFEHFERWLSSDGHRVEDPRLAEFLERWLTGPGAAKMVLLTEEVPVWPPGMNAAWIEPLPVAGFTTEHAKDYLRNGRHVELPEELLGKLAEHFGGHPFALQLLAADLEALAPAERDGRARQILQVGGRAFDRAALGPLFEKAWARLSPDEVRLMELLATVRAPLSPGEILGIGLGSEPEPTRDELEAVAGHLVGRRQLLWRLAGPGQRLTAPEIVRQMVEERLLQDRPRRIELHRRALAWYEKTFPPSEIEPLADPPKPEIVAGYDELVRHALHLAELSAGDERERAAVRGTTVALALRNWHVLREEHRLMIEQFDQGRRLLAGRESKEALQTLAGCTRELGDRYVRTDRLKAAEQRYGKALSLYRQIADRRGEANTLRALGELYVRTNRLQEAEQRHDETLTLFRQLEERLGKASTLNALGDLYLRTARLKEAEQRYDEALPLYRQVEERHGEADTLRALGDLYVRTDRLKEAEQRYGEALPLFRQIEDRLGEANTLLVLGYLYLRTARFKEAEQRYDEALPLFRQIEERLGKANSLRGLGDVYFHTGRLKEAEQRYDEALPLFRQIEERIGKANSLRALGDLYLRTDRLKEAERRYDEALPLFRQIEERIGEATTLRGLGDLYVRTGRLKEAEQRYDEALPLFRQIEERIGKATTLLVLGEIYARTARLKEAEQRYGEALLLFRKIEQRLGKANTLKALGDLYVRTDQLKEAEQRYGEALLLFRQIEARLGEANTLQVLGDLYVHTDRLKEAEQRYGEALPLLRQIEDRLGEANTLLALGNLYVRTDRLNEAEQRYNEALSLYRKIEARLGEANTRLALGGLHAAHGKIEQAIAEYEAARGIYQAIDENVGQINCAIDLSDLFFKAERYDPALEQALIGLLKGVEIEAPQAGIILARTLRLYLHLGSEDFEARAARLMSAFSPDQQAVLREVLDFLRQAMNPPAPEPPPQPPSPSE